MPAIKIYSEAEYLALEKESSDKHFYYDGEIYAMAGASYEHNMIESNLRFALHAHLKGGNCKEFGSNLRLQVPGHSFYTYPDILVICGDPIFRTDTFDTVTNPTILIEILSEGTADYDKGLKFDLYRYLQTLQEYVLVDSRKQHVMVYSRNGDGSWTMVEYKEASAKFRLHSIDLSLSLADCYTGLNLPAS